MKNAPKVQMCWQVVSGNFFSQYCIFQISKFEYSTPVLQKNKNNIQHRKLKKWFQEKREFCSLCHRTKHRMTTFLCVQLYQICSKLFVHLLIVSFVCSLLYWKIPIHIEMLRVFTLVCGYCSNSVIVYNYSCLLFKFESI